MNNLMSASTAAKSVVLIRMRGHAITGRAENPLDAAGLVAGPESPHPSAIQHEEVDRIVRSRGARAEESVFYHENKEALRLGEEIVAAEAALARDVRWTRMIETLELSGLDVHLLAAASALALDPSLGRVYAYLHDQPEMLHATVWLAVGLFGSEREDGLASRFASPAMEAGASRCGHLGISRSVARLGGEPRGRGVAGGTG